MNSSPTPILLAYPFRPFFLLGALYSALLIVAWMGVLFGGWALPAGIPLVNWHAHEMLLGFMPAIVAGFLLTAMTNWTGAAPLQGKALLALLLLWGAGRVAMWTGGLLPAALVALADLLFLPTLAIYVGRVLHRHGNRRNYLLVLVIAALALANVLMHQEFWGIVATAQQGKVLAMNLIAIIMIVIGGRITPAFTANWLRLQGQDPQAVKRSDSLDRAALIAAGLMIPADLLTGMPLIGVAAALLAAIANGIRLAGWGASRVLREPLLWVLHLGYAWIVLALVLKALTPLFAWPATLWMHAMGTGAAGTLILGVMTRVSVGHTGRPLRLVPFGLSIYIAVTIAAAVRLLAASRLIDYRIGLLCSALAWSAAFLIFLILYWPILSRPRADGRPG